MNKDNILNKFRNDFKLAYEDIINDYKNGLKNSDMHLNGNIDFEEEFEYSVTNCEDIARGFDEAWDEWLNNNDEWIKLNEDDEELAYFIRSEGVGLIIWNELCDCIPD